MISVRAPVPPDYPSRDQDRHGEHSVDLHCLGLFCGRLSLRSSGLDRVPAYLKQSAVTYFDVQSTTALTELWDQSQPIFFSGTLVHPLCPKGQVGRSGDEYEVG